MPTRLAEDIMIESRRLGNFAGRAKMFSSLIKLAISTLALCLIATAGDFERRMGKCCPYDQVLIIFDELTCLSVEGAGERMIYHLNYDEDEAGFMCPESENVTITALENIVEQPLQGRSACIDILYDQFDKSNIHVKFQCGPSEDAVATGSVALPELPNLRMCCGSDEERRDWDLPDGHKAESLFCRSTGTGEAATGSLAASNFLTLRICCSVDKVYSVDKRDCVPKKGRWDVPKNVPFLDQKFDFVTVVRGAPPCRYALLDYVVDFTRDLRVKDDGTLEVILTTTNGRETIIVNEKNMCLDRGESTTSDLVVIRACSDSRFCKEHPCVRKCCPDDQAWIGFKCIVLSGKPTPGRFHDVLLNESIARGLASHKDALITSDYGLLIGKRCRYFKKLYNDWHISPRGYVYLSNGKVFESDDHCLEMSYTINFIYETEPDTSRMYLAACVESLEEYLDRLYNLHAAFQLTSCAFLIITLLVYICLPVLRNLRGKILMCHTASLFVGYACFATLMLIPIPDEICPSLGYVTFFSWTSAFSWLNVFCFDMWWTLSGKIVTATSQDQADANNKRFLLYSLYAWAYTFLATLMCIAVDVTEFVPSNMRPNIGISSCWFKNGNVLWDSKIFRRESFYGEFIFFIVPVFLQIVANVIFFTLTARYCNRVKAQITKMTASPTEPRSQRFRAARKELIISIKLFLVMGLTFIFQLIFRASMYYDFQLTLHIGLMFAQDVVNCLHGFTIFFLFVINGRVYKALLNRIGRGNINNIAPADDAEALRARREVPSLLPIPTEG